MLKARSAAFVAVSEADMGASKRPITVKNAEKTTSMFSTVMGLLLVSISASKMATKSCTFVAVSEADVDASKKYAVTSARVRNREITLGHHQW